ncbi:MAG: hypothetical protein GY737_16075 [Desulfobacteraceae bacterium]|nr:hypothetical protein [Desulfobacteraceae bacterium]
MNISIKIYAFHYLYINKFVLNLKNFFKKSNFTFCRIKDSNMIIKNEKITILKSPHVNKSARDQFERKTYIKTVQIVFENKNINDKFLIKLLNLIKFLSLNVKIKFSVKK